MLQIQNDPGYDSAFTFRLTRDKVYDLSLFSFQFLKECVAHPFNLRDFVL